MTSTVKMMARAPSVKSPLARADQHRVKTLTEPTNDLSLDAMLILEATSEIAHASLSIACHIRDVADLAEHVAAGKEKDEKHGARSP